MKLTSLVRAGIQLASQITSRRSLALASSAIAAIAPVVVPSSLQAAQTYTWKSVVTDGGGGFVPGIIFNPSEKNLIYARTDIGGAYRWEQSTKSWTPLLDWLPTSDWNLTGVVTLATDPVETNRLYIAGGTYTNSWAGTNGAILRSTDKGKTFQRTDLPFKLGGNMPGRNIGERMAVDPHKNSIIYLGAPSGNGLWKSTDFGVTWNKVTSFPTGGTYVQVPGDVYQGDITGIGWVTFDQNIGSAGTASPNIYVGVVDKGINVYRSTDAGATWAPVPGQPTIGYFPHHGVIGSNGIMYFTYSDTQGPYDGGKGDVWKLDTKTDTWTLISPIPSTNSGDYFGYGGLAVDAQHPNTLMVAALNSWWPDTIIFRSLDGGATWTRAWDWAGYPGRSLRYTQDISAAPWLDLGAIDAPPVPAIKLGWMIDGFAIDPFDSNRMMYGTGLTLYGTENLTAWDTGGKVIITPMAKNFEETSVQDLISPPAGAPLVSAQADVGGFRHDSLTTPPAKVFPVPNFTTSTHIDFAELMPNFMVRSGNSTTQNARIVFSFDGGGNWFKGNSEPAGASNGGDVAANANATIVLFSPTNAPVSSTKDNGNTWTAATGIPSGATLAADRVNPAKFYGVSNGAAYFSADGGLTFKTAVTPGIPTWPQIKAVPGKEGDVWIAGHGVNSGMWRSTDSGATYTKVATVADATNIGFGQAAPGQNYPAIYSNATIGGVTGIFRSDDVGATWIRINDDQHQYATSGGAITGDPRVYGRVYLANNGRGIIYGELSGPATPDFALSAAPSTVTVAQGATATSTITVGALNGFTGAVALTASGLPTGVTASFSPLSAAGTSTLTLTASSTATAGLANVTITGTSGGLSHTTALSLTVKAPTPPDFSLSATPATVTVAQGLSVTSTITVSPLNGFAGSVALSASGLPTGVTASFSPASTTGASTLTLTASSSATAGPATVTITGTSGTLSHSASISLTVTATAVADFSLSAAPATLSVAPGASATSTITVNKINGFSGTVSLAATGLPAGVTASFSPASTTGASTLTLTASSSAAAGAATVTVTGTSGALSHTASISLTVTAPAVPDFSLAGPNDPLPLAQGTSATSTITVLKVNGFSGTVALSASGLPSGLTVSFSPASTTSTSIITFAASSTATPGLATITVTGTSGTLTHTKTIPVNITVPAVADFSLAAAPASVAVTRGASVTSTVTVTKINGFAGTVALAASGLPAGVTASFSPASTAGTSTLTLTAASNATLGVASVTVTGTSGALTHAASIGLTVNDVGTLPCATPTPITLPFAQNGAGEFCWVTSGNISFVNSWNAQLIEINGVNFTNKWSNALPARINGNYYIHYVSTVSWAHFEANGSGGTTTPPVAVTGVTVAPATGSVAVGATLNLTASVAPATATVKTVTWSSSNSAVATVSAAGIVTGVSAGTATITATTQDGGFTATSTVTVTGGSTTPTPCTGGTAATLPLAQNGAGEFCFVTSGTISFINSWNMQLVEINGVNFTNKWSNALPAKINGNYYIHYVANVAWAHLEVNGTP